ncbi:YafY family protein [Hasllibacter sp. MH4015]|uniref:helix-turn-helix transcriptional regulator n=1 Tax=Hasllibacter sp. MH4015 TaxID=2854029 RepID=UPI001CD43266|nr:HTH domain-containing protein [Hasllibacter sp. MH4015]
MRASRLLRILLILQNRGRRTAAQLAAELECVPRTILRDVDAMTEAGLPIIVHQGNQGGIELGFNYRTRLTGLTEEEARAMAIQLSAPTHAIDALGMPAALHSARAKFIESLPDRARKAAEAALAEISVAAPDVASDPYVIALAEAVRDRRIVRLRARSGASVECHPARLSFDGVAWALHDARAPDVAIPQGDWGDLNISARRYCD